MTLKSTLSVLLVLCLGLTVACQRRAAGTTVDMSAEKARKAITTGTWTLSTLGGATPTVEPGQRMPSLTFTADGKVSGFTGCNPMQGSYTLEDGLRLRFSEMAVGLSACPAAETEKAFLKAVNTTDNFTVDDDVLSLNIARRAPLATLTRGK